VSLRVVVAGMFGDADNAVLVVVVEEEDGASRDNVVRTKSRTAVSARRTRFSGHWTDSRNGWRTSSIHDVSTDSVSSPGAISSSLAASMPAMYAIKSSSRPSTIVSSRSPFESNTLDNATVRRSSASSMKRILLESVLLFVPTFRVGRYPSNDGIANRKDGVGFSDEAK
jgi:hypothetical protein